MWPALEQSLARYHELESQMSDPALVVDRARYAAVAKEHGALARRIKPYLEYKELSQAIKQSEEMLASETDPDMKQLAEEELATLRPRHEALKTRLEDFLLEDPAEQFDSVILEIRAGTGGDEAALFAGDLYGMYTHYARDKGWKVEDISHSPGTMGGFKEVIFSVSGEEVWQHLRYESGGHRVQRVPETEQQGRIHTSAATVAVMPEPDEVQVDIKESDIEWERMRAGGAGGQHVNKTESAVRIWYKKDTPDQIEIKCQDERSQHKNYERAMRLLRSKVYERQLEKLHRERVEHRKSQIGSGDRSERIRTYNFPQNRFTDHRINLTLYQLDQIITGNLIPVVQALRDHDRRERLGAQSN